MKGLIFTSLCDFVENEFGLEYLDYLIHKTQPESKGIYTASKTYKDQEIFNYARRKNAIVISKDDDFVTLVNRLKSPPKIIWITCGNTTNKFLKDVFINKFEQALELLKDNDIVEITN